MLRGSIKEERREPIPQRFHPVAILLITLDTTRADHLGAYGWPHARTPIW